MTTSQFSLWKTPIVGTSKLSLMTTETSQENCGMKLLLRQGEHLTLLLIKIYRCIIALAVIVWPKTVDYPVPSHVDLRHFCRTRSQSIDCWTHSFCSTHSISKERLSVVLNILIVWVLMLLSVLIDQVNLLINRYGFSHRDKLVAHQTPLLGGQFDISIQ